MPLVISDEALRAMDMSADEAPVELACLLFDAAKMSFGHAAKMAGISEEQFGEEIERRNIPRYRYTGEHLRQDLQSIESIREQEKAGK